MKKIIRLTESDLTLIVKRILKETAEVAQPQQQAQAQELYGKRKTRYGECLVLGKYSTAWGEKDTGLTKDELEKFDKNKSCRRCMKKEKPSSDDVRDCLGILCGLKTSGANTTNSQRYTTMYSCFGVKYKYDYNVASVMC